MTKNNYKSFRNNIENDITKKDQEINLSLKEVSKIYQNYKNECLKGMDLIYEDLLLIKDELKIIKPQAIIYIIEKKESEYINFLSSGLTGFKITCSYNCEQYQNISEKKHNLRIRVGSGLPGAYDFFNIGNDVSRRSYDGQVYLNFEHLYSYLSYNDELKNYKLFLEKFSKLLFETFLNKDNTNFKFYEDTNIFGYKKY